ncbi:LuxR C-terminal-related transcriptional regulator [Desulfovibrio sp. OttesenSCG-928-C14]|nr:LuxR C-terminal-related transcriptional regulator [Desulfovibrio sp. OttesenSCG-928-C14]
MAALPVKGPSIPRGSRQRLQMEIVAFSGAGFALGFGWLWFSALQTIWLPDFLWGHLLSGGGTSLFAVLTVAGFFLAGLILRFCARKISSGAQDGGFRTGKLPGIIHGSALLLVVGGISFTNTVEFSEFLPAACIALAGVFLGLYWVAALLCLTPMEGVAAFVVACAVSAGLGLAAESVPGYAVPWLLCCAIGGGWLATFGLAKALQQLFMVSQIILQEAALSQKRPRGRPQQAAVTEPFAPDSPIPLHWGAMVFVPLLFFLTGLAEAGLMFGTVTAFAGKPLGSFPALALSTAGGMLGLLACHKANARKNDDAAPVPEIHFAAVAVISGAFIAQGLALLCLPACFPYVFPVLEGMACATLFALLAALRPGDLPSTHIRSVQRTSWIRSALVLGCAMFCAYFGSLMSGYVLLANDADLDMGQAAAAVTGVISLILSAAALAGAVWDRHRLLRAGASPEKVLCSLTQREYEVASLVMQDKSNKEISAELFVSEETVRFHLKNIYQKTSLSDRETLRTLGRN